MNLRLTRRGRLAGAKRGSRVSQIVLNPLCGWVRAAEHAPRNLFYVLERRHGLAEIVERGGGVLVSRARLDGAMCRAGCL